MKNWPDMNLASGKPILLNEYHKCRMFKMMRECSQKWKCYFNSSIFFLNKSKMMLGKAICRPEQSCGLMKVNGSEWHLEWRPKTRGMQHEDNWWTQLPSCLLLPLGLCCTRRDATLFSSPTTKATSPDSSGVTILSTRWCSRPWNLIWFRSLCCRWLEPNHHSAWVTPSWDTSQRKWASSPTVRAISCMPRVISTRSGLWMGGGCAKGFR